MRYYRCVDCGTEFPAGSECPRCADQYRHDRSRPEPRRDRYDDRDRDRYDRDRYDDDYDRDRYDRRDYPPEPPPRSSIWPSFGGTLLGGVIGILFAMVLAPLATETGPALPWAIGAVFVMLGATLFTLLFTTLARAAKLAHGLGGGMLGGGVGGTVIGGILAYAILFFGMMCAGCAGVGKPNPQAAVQQEETRVRIKAASLFGIFVMGGAILGGLAGLAGTAWAKANLDGRRLADDQDRSFRNRE